jgi:hypothetical protein
VNDASLVQAARGRRHFVTNLLRGLYVCPVAPSPRPRTVRSATQPPAPFDFGSDCAARRSQTIRTARGYPLCMRRSAARRLLRLPELAPRRLFRRHHDAPGVLRRQRREAGVLDLDLRDVTCLRCVHRAEYRYWYDGRPAAYPLPDVKGVLAIKRRTRREGGALQTRMCRCTAWSCTHASGHQASASANSQGHEGRDRRPCSHGRTSAASVASTRRRRPKRWSGSGSRPG